MDFNIPTEVKDKGAFQQLKKIDRQIIAYAVLFGVGNQEAFMRFHPEYLDASGKAMNAAGKQASTMFWNYGKVKDYREQYEKELAEFLGRKQANGVEDMTDGSDLSEARKDKALKSLLHQAMGLVEGRGELDAETLKIAAEIFKKVGLLKDEVEQQEAPRRYLPCKCNECIYKSFVESHVESGEIENACLRCKALSYAKNNGFRYDPTNLLESPINNQNE